MFLARTGLPDLERLISRIHANSCKLTDFIKVLDVRDLCSGCSVAFLAQRDVDPLVFLNLSLQAFDKVKEGIDHLRSTAESFDSTSVLKLLEAAPDLDSALQHVRSLFTYVITPFWTAWSFSYQSDDALALGLLQLRSRRW